ncbi:MAG TPA: sigma-70 family RNA polymerase sigma factor, partial [Gaiellaceae bacterium]|nr:sigma-70 family RNA polymerase sigma factor [Gaiellaceae bacterium]
MPRNVLMDVRDDELVAVAVAGDAAAFAELFTRHRTRVRAVLERMVGEESEDLLQETALRAFLGLSQPERFGAWLCGIAVNLAKMRLRRRALERSCATGKSLEERAVLQLVRDAVELLPLGQREVVLMHCVDDLSCEEIASLLDSTPGAVRVRLHRVRQQLRDELAAFAPRPTPKEEVQMIEMRLKDVVVRVAEGDPLSVVAPHRIVLL